MCAFDPKDLYAMNVYCGSYLDEGFDLHAKKVWGVEKFDIIVMNPPYNSDTNNRGSAHILWDKFVVKTLSQLVEAGYLVAVHPDNWRGFGRAFKEVSELLKSKQILSLEIHTIYDGLKTFGVQTTYDFYCLQNVEPTMFTKIVCQDGTIERVDISSMPFIPNGMFEMYEHLIAKNDDEKINLIRTSKYHTQKNYVSKEQTDVFKYPLVYFTYKDGSMKFKYSSTNEHGYFGIPKVIFTDGGASTAIVDEHGEYATTEFAYTIIDEPKNLFFIKRALNNPEFWELMSFADGKTGDRQRYNHKVISMFRKNFWEEFQPA